MARLEDTRLTHTVEAGRLAFLFVASGDLTVAGETLHAGDAGRITGPYTIDLSGSGEAVLWDVPPLGNAA